MTTVLGEITKKLQSLDPDQLVADSLKRNIGKIEDLNRAQLNRGKLSDGTNVKNLKSGREKYSPNSMNRRLGRVRKRYRLRFTGRYHKNFRGKIGNSNLLMTNRDGKDRKLSQDYTRKIKGLTENSITLLQRITEIDLRVNFRRQMQSI